MRSQRKDVTDRVTAERAARQRMAAEAAALQAQLDNLNRKIAIIDDSIARKAGPLS